MSCLENSSHPPLDTDPIAFNGSVFYPRTLVWRINELSGQPIALGGVGLVRILPVLAFSLLAGAVADALNRRRLMLLTQACLASLAVLLGWLTLRGFDSIGLIYAVIAVSAVLGTFDIPARQSLVPNLVPRDVLTNAFSLNSIVLHIGLVVVPAIGGIVLAEMGIAYAYLINSFSYLAMIIALLIMDPLSQAIENPMFFMGGPQLGELEAGLVGQWLGAPFAVVSGGLGCLLAVALIARRLPQLCHYKGYETIVGEGATTSYET